ncbi:MAG TPA: GNAT family N-acetyltransferase [Lachnospiraceae bacterium]|nr:GNAT family N-acetyltransferase [Lachnospiraceae bacterium]
MEIRVMKEADYDQVNQLWHQIKGFGIRSIDDSRESIGRFLRRNATTSIVAEEQGEIIGSILCGHDGRTGYFYHVCVKPEHRRKGIGKAMVGMAMNALREEHINKAALIAFTKNDIGNAFWKQIGWEKRQDLNYYEFTLNEANITAFIEQ